MVDMVAELALTEGFTVDLTSMAGIDEVEQRRNLVAHGIWYDGGNGRFLLQDLRGSWPKSGTTPKIRRRIIPAAAPITPDNLEDLSNAISALTQNVYAIARSIQARRSAFQQRHRAPVHSKGNLDQGPPAVPKRRRTPSPK